MIPSAMLQTLLLQKIFPLQKGMILFLVYCNGDILVWWKRTKLRLLWKIMRCVYMIRGGDKVRPVKSSAQFFCSLGLVYGKSLFIKSLRQKWNFYGLIYGKIDILFKTEIFQYKTKIFF
jgi:hypothetical protein